MIRISEYSNGHGVKLEINGFEVPELSDFTVKFPVDGAVTIDASVYATKPFDICLDGGKPVTVHFHNVQLAEAARRLIERVEETYGTSAVKVLPEFGDLRALLGLGV